MPTSRLPLAALGAALVALASAAAPLTAPAGAQAPAQRPAAGAAQDAKGAKVRRPTVPVVPVANVTARTGGQVAAVTPPARPKPGSAAKPGAKPTAKPGDKPAAKPAPRAVASRPSAATDSAAGEVTAPAAPATGEARFARYRSTRDSVAGELARAAAERSSRLRVVVQLDSRELAVLDGADTLLVAPVAIGRDTTIRYGSRTWSFDTPRGTRTVKRKNENPVWVPPDWHYAEVALKKGLRLEHLGRKPVSLGGGRSLVVRGGVVGVQQGKRFEALPTDEEIVFGNTLFVPPLGTKNRQIEGELGRFRLDLGDGYQLHGTPHEDTIGDAATHGCIRLYDEDIEWLYQHVPLGTPVYIF